MSTDQGSAAGAPVRVTPFPASGRPVLSAAPLKAMLFCVVMVLGVVWAPSPGVAGAAGSSLREYGADWQPPVAGLEVLRDYAAPPAPWLAGHRGVDLAVPAGGDIRAPADGVVSFSGVVVNREVLSIDHGAGYVSSFEPVDSELEAGDVVGAGQVIATLGTYLDSSGHCPDQTCVHWGVRLHGEYINPLLMLGTLEPSVLLPLEQGNP